MANENKRELTPGEAAALLKILKTRFGQNTNRHKNADWPRIESRLKKNPEKLWSLNEMEKSGGEPDVVSIDERSEEYVFIDCSKESPTGRRSICYDREALESRKKFKPKNSALDMASAMGIGLLNEHQYKKLQEFGNFDTKTSSWIETPAEMRKLGGALFGDYRFGRVFFYHNGAESYYAARGFRGLLRV